MITNYFKLLLECRLSILISLLKMTDRVQTKYSDKFGKDNQKL